VGVGESLKDQVYGQVVEEIEEKYEVDFGCLKKAFCEKYGVTLGSSGVDLVI
jgi:hypothetical protein